MQGMKLLSSGSIWNPGCSNDSRLLARYVSFVDYAVVFCYVFCDVDYSRGLLRDWNNEEFRFTLRLKSRQLH